MSQSGNGMAQVLTGRTFTRYLTLMREPPLPAPPTQRIFHPHMKIVSVSSVCPYCGGGAALLSEPTDASNAKLIDQFTGTRVQCQHRGCEKTYFLRRVDVKIRRTDA